MSSEYLTWLDWYAARAAENLRAGGYPTSPRMGDGEALWIMCLTSMSAMDDADKPRKQDWNEAELARYVFFGAVAAIAAPTGGALNPWREFIEESRQKGHGIDAVLIGGIGLKLSSRLVAAFAHAKAPKTDDWAPMTRERGWYLDIPHRSLMMGRYQIRAILIHPDTLDAVAAVAILTDPGSNEIAGRYAWMLIGDDAASPGIVADEQHADRKELQRRANDFIALALLYYKSLEHTERLPRRQTGPGLSRMQRRLERKTRSLFVVHNLPDPVGNLGRPVETAGAGESGGWRLDHRVTVRGHFRWQPVGEGRSRRELRWIAEHQRGAGLPEKPELIPLRVPNR